MIKVNLKKYIIGYITIFFCFLANADTYTVVLYTPANPPYTISFDDNLGLSDTQGIFVDLFSHIGKLTGDEFKFVKMPVGRALKEFVQGNVDIEPGVNPKWRQDAGIVSLYSIAYSHSEEVILFRAGEEFSVKDATDLYGKTVGVVRGFTYPKFSQAIKEGKIKLILNKSQDLLVYQLIKKRVDRIFVGKATIEYLQKTDPKINKLVVGDIISSVEVMMRVHPNKKELLPRLNNALEQMMHNKIIKKIINKYR